MEALKIYERTFLQFSSAQALVGVNEQTLVPRGNQCRLLLGILCAPAPTYSHPFVQALAGVDAQPPMLRRDLTSSGCCRGCFTLPRQAAPP